MTQEKEIKTLNGWIVVPFVIAGYALALYALIQFILEAIQADKLQQMPSFASLCIALVLLVATFIVNLGLFSLQPGQARICILFGNYKGTVKTDGLHFVNPFFARSLSSSVEYKAYNLSESNSNSSSSNEQVKVRKTTISLRARTLTGDRLKVNDKMGNPIEIATVIVWRVVDTAKAVFDVDNYEAYVDMQTETAVRHVASLYAYDHMEDDDATNTAITLRSNIEDVSQRLRQELSAKLAPAGVTVEDARLTHLAYAPEIAQAMLRRQQAEAVIAARKKIVEGAVSMVNMALTSLAQEGVVAFDDDKKAAMASNLMVVLCGESETQPVLNTGSLYQ
ncbi:SPFH domain-containing protein [Fannyhessea vaginae]|uniref:SPFH domain-containing protein n=1 Tax=Fannyhessea vaginae TaxID=82135 RepID=UPI0026EE51C1|nr:SPFH domain-containing protein [Fannyhessea vaginae]